MYSTVCKQNGNSDRDIATFISTGFVGQLRGWWDHYLTDSQKKDILDHKKMIKSEASGVSTTGEEDAVYTLYPSTFCWTNIPIGEKFKLYSKI
ncbi:unnamed protein product [Lathyrus sativus]|nr:unnamed protein product [Lathyrus sativus]